MTVDSAAALAATRCSASATRFRARRFASVAASSSSLAHPSGELVAHLLLRGGEDPLPRLAGRHAGDPLELGAVAQLELLHLLLQLPQVNLAVGDALLAAGQLGQLPVDVVLLREDALLDLHHRVAPLTELLLEVGAQLDRLLARLDRSLPARRVGLAARLVQQQRALAPRGLESRPCHEPQPEKRRATTDCQCDHDCYDNEHWRLLGLVPPAARRVRRSTFQARPSAAPRDFRSVSRSDASRSTRGSVTEVVAHRNSGFDRRSGALQEKTNGFRVQ